MSRRSYIILVISLCLATALIFMTDLVTMLGFAHGMLYVIVVMLAAFIGKRQLIIAMSALAVGLILAGFFLSPPAPETFPYEYVLANRVVSILVVLTAALLAIARITQIQRSQEVEGKLAAAQRVMRMAGEMGGIGSWTVRKNPTELKWSDQVHRLHGTEPGTEPDLEKAIEFYVPESRPLIKQRITDCLNEGTSFDEELQIINTRGEKTWVRAVGHPLRNDRGEIIGAHGSFMDINESKRIAIRLTNTLESISDAFILLDQDWKFTFLNSHAEVLLERSREDLIGRNVWEEFPEAVGSKFDTHYREAVKSGQPVTFENHYAPLKRWFRVYAYPSDEGLAVYFQDITERRSIEEQLRQSQRLEAIGQLTGGIAHDFNNLLTVLFGNAELMREDLPDDHPLKEVAGTMVQAARRGSDLTQRLLAFARRQALDPKPIDVNRLIAHMDGLLRRSLGDHVEIELSRGGGLWLAMVDDIQLESALLNLCLNARDAMPDGGRLTIETANVRLDYDYAEQHGDIEPGQYVMVAVSDTGKGIDPDHLDKVFEPFFTTKEKGKGTGLGLSMIYGFIKQSSGHVKIYSEPGEGTTVRMYLPRAHKGGETLEMPSTADSGHKGDETILLVEDDELVRNFAEQQIKRLGYRVLVASNGPQAMELLHAHPEIGLLFTDVVMPGGMSGRDLADQALGLRPDLKVLYTSGYTENAIVHHGRLDPDVQLLQKPYRRSDLARRLRSILDNNLQSNNKHDKQGEEKP
jgi:PAS domain S-box-containing protein